MVPNVKAKDSLHVPTATARPALEVTATQGMQRGEMVFGRNASRLVSYIVAKVRDVSNAPGGLQCDPLLCSYRARFNRFNNTAINREPAFGGAKAVVCL